MIDDQGGQQNWDDEQYYSSYDKALREFLSNHSSDYIDLFLLGMDLANVNNENVGENLGEFLYKNSSNVYKYISNLRLCCELNINEEDYDKGKINIYYPNANYAAQPMLIVGDPLKEANRYDIRFVLRENSSTDYDYDNAYATPGWYEGEPDDTIVTR